MKFKNIMLVTFLLLAILTIGAVSAAEDTNDTLTDDNSVELSQELEDEMVSTADDGNDVLSVDESTYSELSNEIDSGGIVSLRHDYYAYDSGSTIVITKNNTRINGNGAVIDMAGSNIQVFKVKASGVTIKNLTIKNVNYDDDGGAIYFNSNGAVENCNFINTTLTWYGDGAVCFEGSGTVVNCNFVNNTADYGGAISLHSGSIENCNFENNAARCGGAIDSYDATVSNCNFTNNKASEGGSAIDACYGIVENCNFVNNSASCFGAISIEYNATVSNCNFVNNTVCEGYGGAFGSYGGGKLINCNFVNNTATGYDDDGGAIFFYTYGNVINCNFTNNKARDNGGAVYFYRNGEITNCNFVNNTAADYGGAVEVYGNATLTGCNFVNNSASYGGAIYFENETCEGTVEKCNFTNNAGSAVYLRNYGDVADCYFVNNSGYNGGAIQFNRNGQVMKCNFVNNTAAGSGGAISIREGNITNSIFANNTAASSGGAISFNANATVVNCDFVNNSASYGGAVSIEAFYFINSRFAEGSGTVVNCDFVNNSASYGGALYLTNKGDVIDCDFVNNSAASYGGAIYWRSSFASMYPSISSNYNVFGCNFTKNAADTGGAIGFKANATVKKSNFKDNFANNCSDIFSDSQLVLDNNTFDDNSTQQSNSTVVSDIANVKVTLSKTAFTYNGKVQKPKVTLTGGAVLKEGVDYTLKWSSASPKNAGAYSVTVTGIGAYSGTVKVTFKINKAANPLAVKAKTVKVKFSAVKKKAQTLAVSKVVTFTKKGQGTLTYAKASGNKKITINKKTGKVTVGKGLKKGTYKVKVKIKAAGNANYKASAYKTVTFKIVIK